LGAAYLAGLSAGYWANTAEILDTRLPADEFEPRMTEKRRAELLAGWREAVRSVTGR
jgi:glycerol kinase